MKFPRSTRLFRGQLDLAPFLCVLFLLAFALALRDFLVLPRGARLELPAAASPIAAGAGERLWIIALDASRRLYFENQITDRERLERDLRRRVVQAGAGVTLLIQADRSVPFGDLTELETLVRNTGVSQIIFGTRAGSSSHP
ncbi:MAG: biopolymer transporter ExbD [Verrucomicrobia bacterium]|nr:biopolymer transporter ExbD [Verrucomicrobiota bacterium]